MPIVELKNALAAWKKAKPMLLTKTGISEVLRPLEKYDPKHMDDASKWLKVLAGCQKVLEVGVANKHISVHKAAHACLLAIRLEVTHQTNSLKRWQTDMNRELQSMSTSGAVFAKTPTVQGHKAMAAALRTYNDLLDVFVPTSASFAQVPSRLVMSADNVLKTQVKMPHKADVALEEFEKELDKISRLRI